MRAIEGLTAVVLAALPIAASAQQQSEPLPRDSELPALQILRQVEPTTPPDRRLEVVDRALAILPQPTPFRGAVLCERWRILSELDRDKEAETALTQCRQLRPDDPNVLIATAFSELERRRPVEAAGLLTRVASTSPDAIRRLGASELSSVIRQLRYAGAEKALDDMTAAFAGAGWARDYPQAFSDMATRLIRRRLADGDQPAALALLPSVLSPAAGLGMLIDRRYEPIWPRVETWAGTDLSIQREALLDGSGAASRNLGTADAFLAYMSALAGTGHRDDAIAQLRSWIGSPPPNTDAYSRNAAVVRLGRLLSEAGRGDEGIARMKAALQGLDAADPSTVNVVPNLVIAMLLAHDAAGALAILDKQTPNADAVEAPPALGYFVALRACALQGVGRSQDAAKALTRVRALYANNAEALSIAVSCVDTPDGNAAHWTKRAENPEERESALLDIARARARRAAGLPTKDLEETAMRSIADRPDVVAAYDRLARPLPSSYVPALLNFEVAPRG